MEWLQDRKNLPYVIGGVGVVIVAAGVFLLLQIRGRSDNLGPPTTQQATTDYSGGMATPSGTAAVPSPSAVPGPAGTIAPTTSTGLATPGAPAAPAVAPASKPEAVVAANPVPIETWRADPFVPTSEGRPPRQPPRPRLEIPMLDRLFAPKPKPVESISDRLIPLPPRRVAGILFSDRVSALIQTPDGWETVKPGGTLRDGTIVERIERDRVVLRTVDKKPRLIEVRLAASTIPVAQPQQGVGGTPGGGTPGYSPGGFVPPYYRPGRPGAGGGGVPEGRPM